LNRYARTHVLNECLVYKLLKVCKLPVLIQRVRIWEQCPSVDPLLFVEMRCVLLLRLLVRFLILVLAAPLVRRCPSAGLFLIIERTTGGLLRCGNATCLERPPLQKLPSPCEVVPQRAQVFLIRVLAEGFVCPIKPLRRAVYGVGAETSGGFSFPSSFLLFCWLSLPGTPSPLLRPFAASLSATASPSTAPPSATGSSSTAALAGSWFLGFEGGRSCTRRSLTESTLTFGRREISHRFESPIVRLVSSHTET
jgi:hypothetical protein